MGTLYHLRQHFRLVNVSNNVKKNYKSAENLTLSATKAYLCTAFKTWAGLEKLDGLPSNLPKLPTSSDTIEIKKEFIEKHIGKFVDEFVLVEFDVEKAWMEGVEERDQQQVGEEHRDTSEHHTNASDHLPSSAVQTPDAHTSSSSQCDDITVGMYMC